MTNQPTTSVKALRIVGIAYTLFAAWMVALAVTSPNSRSVGTALIAMLQAGLIWLLYRAVRKARSGT